jgi:hypothetical protein
MAVIDRSLTLPIGEFFEPAGRKSGICIHHTVGGSARSTYEWWMRDRSADGTGRRVGTAYLIDRDGSIHEVFAPEAWAYQFGLSWRVDRKLAFEKRFIGIELASVGPLLEKDDCFYCFDRVDNKTRVDKRTVFDFGRPWRGYRYWTRYPNAQVDALIALLHELLVRFGIERQVPSDFLRFYGEELFDFEGVIGHTMVRMDKTDPNPDVEFWTRVVSECGLQSVAVGSQAPPVRGGLITDVQIAALSAHNVEQVKVLDPAAAGLVLSLLDELARDGRRSYLRLSRAAPNGRSVRYELVHGDASSVSLAAQSLGFESWSDQLLKARSR